MNALAIGIGIVVAVGGAAGFIAYEWADPESPADDACRTWDLKGNGGSNTLRFEITNEDPVPVVVHACAITFDHEKVAYKSVTVPANGQALIDLEVPEGTYFAQSETQGARGHAIANFWLCTESMYVVHNTVGQYSHGGDGGDCVDPATQAKTEQQGIIPWDGLRGPVGPALGFGFGAAVLTALAVHFRAKIQFFGFLLFTRLSRPQVLQLESRARIHELVNQEPGIHANAIGERLDLAQGETLYHLHVLVREKVLVRVGNWGLRSFFVAGRWAPAQMRAMAALRSGALGRLFQTVRAQPGATLANVARSAGYSLGRASRLSRRLEEVGLIERRAQGRTLVLVPRPGFESLPMPTHAS